MTSHDSQRLLLLTVDYEIFGNGTGDVRQHILEPTERMARVCERYSFPLTVFFEAEEYLAFERHATELERLLGYDPADLIRKQVAALVERGHHFQLHLHPQWYGAEFQHGQWSLRPKMETVDQLFATEEEVASYISERKDLLRRLMGERGNAVIAYRAGAFSARPGRKLVPALSENGILFDSSVVRGLYNEGTHYTVDYRDARSPKRLWRVRDDVAQESPQGTVWEIPIHSAMRRRFQQMTPHRLRAKFSSNVPAAQRSAMFSRFADPRRPTNLFRSLFERVPIKLDFHNMSAPALYQMIKTPKWDSSLGPDVLVAIGHTKEHLDDRPLQELLQMISEDPQLTVIGFDSVAEDLRVHRRSSDPMTERQLD